MALLFDDAQGTFKDTGSQTSPMKKSTGLMRQQMNKMDEVAPRGHTLAYITPEEAEILNKGGGGIDAEGNQMTGPYGIPMYPGYTPTWNPGIKSSVSTPRTQASPHTNKPSYAQEKKSKSLDAARPHEDKKTEDKKTEVKNISDNKYFQDLHKEELSYVLGQKDTIKDEEIKQTNFNTDRFMNTIGTTINVDGKTINEQLLINPHIGMKLESKEKGDESILDRKNQVSNEIIEHLKVNTPDNLEERNHLLYMLDRMPKNVKDNVKKAIDNKEISLDVKASKSITENFDKISTGDFIFNPHADKTTTVKDAITPIGAAGNTNLSSEFSYGGPKYKAYQELVEGAKNKKSQRNWYYGPDMFNRTPEMTWENMAGSEPFVETPKAKIIPSNRQPGLNVNDIPIADKITINENGIVEGFTDKVITVDDAKKIADDGWSIQNIQNWVPSNIRALASDVWVTQTGIGDHKTFTEKNLSPKYQTVLKEIVKTNLTNKKMKIEYADYETHAKGESQYRDVDASVTNPGLITKMFDPAYNLKTTLGQATIIIDENNNVIIKDRYNFNDAVDIQSVADALNAAAIIGYETGTLKLYGAVRTIGTFFGSNDQEGAFVEINLGNYDELMGN